MKFYKSIILPVDGSDFSKKSVKKALTIAHDLALPVKVIYVVDMSIYTNTISNDEMSVQWESILKKEGKSILDDIKKIAEKQNIEVSTYIKEGNPTEEILKMASRNDLIIMESKGKNTLDRIFIGSTSENVLHHTNASVMIIR